jgi:hypothetical protein
MTHSYVSSATTSLPTCSERMKLLHQLYVLLCTDVIRALRTVAALMPTVREDDMPRKEVSGTHSNPSASRRDALDPATRHASHSNVTSNYCY